MPQVALAAPFDEVVHHPGTLVAAQVDVGRDHLGTKPAHDGGDPAVSDQVQAGRPRHDHDAGHATVGGVDGEPMTRLEEQLVEGRDRGGGGAHAAALARCCEPTSA